MNTVFLTFQNTRGEKEDKEIPEKGLVLGRFDPKNEEQPDILLSHTTVSRKHAIVTRAENSIEVQNFGMNGTLVNGKIIEDKAIIVPGDIITIGGVDLQVTTKDKDPVALKTVVDSVSPPLRPSLSSARQPVRRKKIHFILLVLIAAISIVTIYAWLQKTSPRSGARQEPTIKPSPPESIAPDMIKQNAKAAAVKGERAEKLNSEKRILIGNRYLALVHYRDALLHAKKTEALAQNREKWRRDTLALRRELDSLYQYHKKSAIAASHQKNGQACKDHLVTVMQIFPDPLATQYKWAKKNLLQFKK